MTGFTSLQLYILQAPPHSYLSVIFYLLPLAKFDPFPRGASIRLLDREPWHHGDTRADTF